jgi:hypothetical protein
MQHPEYVRSQIIVELIENEDQKDWNLTDSFI